MFRISDLEWMDANTPPPIEGAAFNLRGYQYWCVEETVRYLLKPEKRGKNPLIVLATGMGKTPVLAALMLRLWGMAPGLRFLSLAHTKGLVQGMYRTVKKMRPSAPVGMYAAGLGARDTRSQATIAMINSVANRAASFGHIDFVFIDEAHRLSDNDATLYGRLLKDLRAINPNLIVIGCTATDYRMKGGRLTDMGLFDDVVFDIGSGESFVWAVQQGYLILPVPTDPGFQLDDSAIGLQGGEYKDNEASAAMIEQDILERAVDFTIQVAKNEGRKRMMCAAQSIEIADLLADMWTYKGYPTYAIHSRAEDRDAKLEMHKKGVVWGITSRDQLTTGYDDEYIDLLVGLRLTRSPGLWVQLVGRTTRPIRLPGYDFSTFEGRWASINASGKTTARVLDFTGNTERLGPINYPHVPGKRKKGSGPAPVRTCKQCDPWTYHHVSVKICPHCDFEWPVESVIKELASTSELVSATNPFGLPMQKPKPKIFEAWSVHDMTVSHNTGRETKDGDGNTIEKKLDTLMVSYRCGTNAVKTWICFEHANGSFPRRKAIEWWEQHGGQGEAPKTIAEAVDRSGDLTMPVFIQVDVSGPYPQLNAYDFAGYRFEKPDLNDLMTPPKIYEREPDPYENKPRYYGAGEVAYGNGYDDDIPF